MTRPMKQNSVRSGVQVAGHHPAGAWWSDEHRDVLRKNATPTLRMDPIEPMKHGERLCLCPLTEHPCVGQNSVRSVSVSVCGAACAGSNVW